jgi:hypothetical protein
LQSSEIRITKADKGLILFSTADDSEFILNKNSFSGDDIYDYDSIIDSLLSNEVSKGSSFYFSSSSSSIEAYMNSYRNFFGCEKGCVYYLEGITM